MLNEFIIDALFALLAVVAFGMAIATWCALWAAIIAWVDRNDD
jgi:hypothetical protein